MMGLRRVNIPSCRLTTDAGGYLDIKGDWDGSSSSWTANVVVNGVPVSSILEDHWRKHVHGSVSGGIDLRGGRDGVTHVAGLARLQGGMLTGPACKSGKRGRRPPERRKRQWRAWADWR